MARWKDVTGRGQKDFENHSEARMIVGRWMIFKKTVREALKM